MLGNPSARAEARCTRRKNAEKICVGDAGYYQRINENYTYMHACMHAGAPLSWKPVTPEGKLQKNPGKITHICMHACMLGHPSAGSR